MRRPLLAFALTVGCSLSIAGAATALGVPVQNKPADGATITGSRNITFGWNLVVGDPEYGIQIQYLNASNNWVTARTVSGVRRSTEALYTYANFNKSDHGRWRVRSEDSSGNSAWSGWRLFFIDPTISKVAQPAKVTERSSLVTVPAHQTRTVQVDCPAGSIAVSGGWNGGPLDSVHTSASLHAGDGWSATFENLTGSSKSVTTYVECLSNVSGYTHDVIVGSSAGPETLAFGQPECSKGVVSGGGFQTFSRSLLPFTSMPVITATDKGWTLFALNTSATTTHAINTEVVCLSGSGATVTQFVSTDQAIGSNGSHSIAFNCGSNRKAIGGGWSSTEDTVAATRSRRTTSGNGWSTRAENRGGDSGTMNVSIICAKFG